MKNITSIPIRDIILPEIIVSIPSQKNIESLCIILSNDTTNQNHFLTLASYHDKLILLSGYDIYLAAKKLHLKSINCIILEDITDPQMTHVIMSQKTHINPIKIIQVMESYVKLYGVKKTLEELHLESIYGKIFSLSLLPNTKEKLDQMCTDAYNDGVNSITPYALLQYISKLEPEHQIELITKLDELRANNRGAFRWPHNDFLRNLVKPESKTSSPAESPISDGFRDFTCTKCKEEYFVNKLRVTPKKIESGMKVMEGDLTQPILEISPKHIKHLGISIEQYPEIILSGNEDTKSILQKLKNRRFVIYVGPS